MTLRCPPGWEELDLQINPDASVLVPTQIDGVWYLPQQTLTSLCAQDLSNVLFEPPLPAGSPDVPNLNVQPLVLLTGTAANGDEVCQIRAQDPAGPVTAAQLQTVLRPSCAFDTTTTAAGSFLQWTDPSCTTGAQTVQVPQQVIAGSAIPVNNTGSISSASPSPWRVGVRSVADFGTIPSVPAGCEGEYGVFCCLRFSFGYMDVFGKTGDESIHMGHEVQFYCAGSGLAEIATFVTEDVFWDCACDMMRFSGRSRERCFELPADCWGTTLSIAVTPTASTLGGPFSGSQIAFRVTEVTATCEVRRKC